MRTAEGLRYESGDRLIVRHVDEVYGPIPVGPDDVLLDLGAHIGTTSNLVLRKGARQAVAVEADPRNVGLLRRNLSRFGSRARIIAAAVGPTDGHVTFYPRPVLSYAGSTLPDDGRAAVTVPTVAFGSLLDRYRPTIVKCDIEFGEYDLDFAALPDHVRVLAMELHVRYIGVLTREQSPESLTERRRQAAALLVAIEAQGFRELRRNDKVARPPQPAAVPDDTGLDPMLRAVDAVWAR